MSDFFTKKQKKYWCECCHVFLEYSKIVIDSHNRTENHKNNSTRHQKYINQKKKFNNYVKSLYQNQNEINNDKKDFLGLKQERNYLEELKMKEIKNSNKKKWGVFFDKKYNLPYFFNFITKESVWEKPKTFDGTQEDIDKIISLNKTENKNNNLNDNYININNGNEGNEGIIGKWVKISKKEGNKIFGKNLEEVLIEKEEKLKRKKRKLENNKKKDIIEINNNTKEIIMNNKIVNDKK